jgi:acetyl esterase/lipase
MSGHSRHCGAFENWPLVLATLAERGYVVASVNYRLSGEAVSPAAAHDIASAVRWLRANSARYVIDRQRLGVWGVSAGGQLAAITGTECESGGGESACVQAVAAWYGIFDFAPMVTAGNEASPAARYLGCASGRCSSESVVDASPIRHVDESDPPFLLVHGALDKTVPASQSQAFQAELQAHRVKSQLIVIDGVDHSFIGSTPAATRAASLQALQVTIDFFDRSLR